MIDMDVEDAMVIGAVVLGGILVCSVIGLCIAITRYLWGLI